MRWFLALGVVVSSVWACDTSKITLFGTGLHGADSLAAVTATVGGVSVPVLFVGDQGQFAGLDQINIGPLPRSLASRGKVTINLTADGKNANAVTVTIR